MVGWLRDVAGGMLLAAAVHGAHAQVYPVRPITIVVPFPPGGGADFVTRLLAERLGPILSQAINVANRGGAGGTLATREFSKAAPDGYTLLYITGATVVTAPILQRTPGYDPLKSLVPISLIGWAPGMAVIHPKLPARDLGELVSLIKASPGRYKYSTSGEGTHSYLAGELFKSTTGLDVRGENYKGPANAVKALVAGEVDMMFDLAIFSIPKVRDGELRALAIMGPNRIRELPDVPTVAEAGMPEFTAYNWSGLAAPSGTAQETVQVLNKAVREVLAELETNATFRNAGLYAEGSTPEELHKLIQAELAKWARALPLSATAR